MVRRIALLTALAALSFSSIAGAHVVITNPPARDMGKAGSDAHKAGPCGVARTNGYTQYAVGAQVAVEYTETIDHRGCFQVLLSEANDTNFRILAQVNDPANDTVPLKRTTMVTLPAGVSCQNCTLSVRQLMINRACVANEPSTNTGAVQAGDTYFTCADICIGTNCPPKSDAGAPVDAAVPASDAGHEHEHDAATPTPTPTTSTPTPTPTTTATTPGGALEPTADDGGCATSPIGVAGGSSVALVGLAASVVALVRRRRRA